MTILALFLLLVGCRSTEPAPDDPETADTTWTRDPASAEAMDLFGLKVGSRWTYLRSGDILRWKEITACEDVMIIDASTGEKRVVSAYVRENRSVTGITSVHYLLPDETGVLRVRRDDVDRGDLEMFTTYEPFSPRVFDGLNIEGDSREFDLATSEYNPRDDSWRGTTEMSAVDQVLGEEIMVVAAGKFRSLGIQRDWTSNNSHTAISHYAAGVGEIREQTIWPGEPRDRIQIEELVDYTEGYARCEPSSEPMGACVGPREVCDNAWGTGTTGCTDPRVDPDNCGDCGTVCDDDSVCAGGRCLPGRCDLECDGSTVCCPNAWDWHTQGCTSPARDRWNCGGCGNVCDETRICVQGECSCTPGTEDCGLGCIDVLEDGRNCGTCGNACGGDTPICDKGVCVSSCLSVDLAQCHGDCVDLDWNDDHCGSCDSACGDGLGTTTCAFGECVTCEEAGQTDCDGDCANLDFSENHCGTCGNACDVGAVCVQGSCVEGDDTCIVTCTDPERICCGGQCIDPRTSDNHCGGCMVDQCDLGCEEACRDGECIGVDCGGGDD